MSSGDECVECEIDMRYFVCEIRAESDGDLEERIHMTRVYDVLR